MENNQFENWKLWTTEVSKYESESLKAVVKVQWCYVITLLKNVI